MPARRPSSFRSQLTWLPSPSTTPRATTSTSPPSVSPAALACVDPRDDLPLRRRDRAPAPRERSAAALSGTGSGSGTGRADAAQRHHVAADLDAELLEQPPRQRPGRHPGRRLPGAGPLQDVARVEPVVLEHTRQVGVARPGPRHPAAAQLAPRPLGRHDVFPVGPVAVRDQHRHRGSPASRPARTPGQPLDPVALDLHPRAAAVALHPARAARGPPHSADTGSPAGSPSTMATRALPWDSPAVVNRSRIARVD